MGDNETDGILWLVMKLEKSLSLNTGLNTIEIGISDCVGFLPVFDSYDNAFKCSENGKYQILSVKAMDRNE